jgi:hypothetical protein
MNRLDLAHRRSLYAVIAILMFTGICWAILRYFPEAVDVDPRHALGVNAMLMKIHGAAAMLALVLLGTLLPRHVLIGLRGRLNRRTGVSIGVLSIALVATGYLLYYAGGETLREIASDAHLGVGLALPVLLAVHVRRVWRERRAMQAAQAASAMPRRSAPQPE